MAAAYTTLVAYIVLALGEAVCAHVVCKKREVPTTRYTTIKRLD